jgi:hypothetical protein
VKEFLIFFSSNNDPLLAVFRAHNRAAARARGIPKTVHIADVDVDTAPASDTRHWSKAGTIECVAVDSDTVIQRQRNPTPEQIDAMIDAV